MAAGIQSDRVLSAYIQSSWDSHPELQSMRAMVAAESSRTDMSRAWMNPEVSFGLMNAPTNFDTHKDPSTAWQIGWAQTVPFPGKVGSSAKTGFLRTAAAQASADEARFLLAGMVVEGYYQWAGAISVRKALEHGKALNQQIMDAAAIRVASGLGSQSDILQARLDLEEWNVKLVNNQSDIKKAQAALAYAVGQTDLMRLQAPNLSDTLPPLLFLDEALVPEVIDNSPSVRKLNLESSAAQAAWRRSKLGYWPDITVMLNYGLRGELRTGGYYDETMAVAVPMARMKQDDMVSIGLSAPLPLFYRGNQRALVRENAAMVRSRSAELDKARLAKAEELRRLHALWQEEADCCRLGLAKIIPLTEDLWQTSLADYQAGKIPFTMLTEARMKVVMAEMDQIMHRADAWIVYHQFYLAQGKLAPEIPSLP
jgi:outer membrane protein TolC